MSKPAANTITVRRVRQAERARQKQSKLPAKAWEADLADISAGYFDGVSVRGRCVLVFAPDRIQAQHTAALKCQPGEEVADIRGPLTREQRKRWESRYE